MNCIVKTIRIFCCLGLALQVLLGLWYFITNVDSFRDIMQVCLAGVAVYFFMCCLINTKKAIISSLVINTIPFVLQGHLSAYIYSIIFSMTFIAMTCYNRTTFKKGKIYSIVILLLFPLCMFLIVISGKETGSLKSAIGMSMVERFAWPQIEGKYKQWMPEEISELFSDAELRSIAEFPYRIEDEWQPRLIEAIGEEETFKVNVAVAKMGIERCSKLNLKNIATDTFVYAMPLFFMNDFLTGKVNSATSFNFHMFLGETPRFASDYFWIIYQLIPYLFCTSIISLFCCSKQEERKKYIKYAILTTVWLLYMGFILALQGTDSFDYKQTLIQQVIIYAVILYFIEKTKGDNRICFK